jgi:hypothetical protein
MGASFAIATGGVQTLFFTASPNVGSGWVRVVDEVLGAVFEQEITVDLPANTKLLSPQAFVNNGATAVAVFITARDSTWRRPTERVRDVADASGRTLCQT